LTARSPWRELQKDIYLGNADFIHAVQKQMNQARRRDGEIPTPQRSAPTPSLPSTFNATADIGATIRELYRSGQYTQRQIAEHLGVHYTTVCRRLKNTTA